MRDTLNQFEHPVRIKQMRYRMGCLVSVEVTHADPVRAASAVEEAFAEMKRVEKMLSRFDADSDISRINKLSTGEEIPLSDELYTLLKELLDASLATGGAFDITTGALTELWNRCAKTGRSPRAEAVLEALSRTGSANIKLNPDKRSISVYVKGIQLDLGAAGKGYALDCAANRLRSCGITEAVLSAGSSILHLGGAPVCFGIQHPLCKDRIAAQLQLQNNSLSTSASYERYFQIGHKRCSHILDPRSGFPVRGNVLSASAAAASALHTEILSTAFFAGGASAVRELFASAGEGAGLLFMERGFIPKSIKTKTIGHILSVSAYGAAA